MLYYLLFLVITIHHYREHCSLSEFLIFIFLFLFSFVCLDRGGTPEEKKAIEDVLGSTTLGALFGLTTSEIKGPQGPELLKKKYKELVLKVHPDKNKAPGADEAFKKVDTAYALLCSDMNENAYALVTSSKRSHAQGTVAVNEENYFREILRKSPFMWKELSEENRPVLLRGEGNEEN
jgi:hypothetical protein